MYESFYGFREKPFSLLPDPSFLFLAKQHKAALAMLEYGLVNQAGFTVVTGEVGCGKTTLIRHLLNSMQRDITVGLLSNTQRAIGELLEWVLLAFGLDFQGKDKVALYQTFLDFVVDEYAKDRRTVLIIDEAQNLGAQTLEELRMLSNINADKDQVLQLILVGQPELRDILSQPDMAQLAQRVAVDYYIERLRLDQTIDYIHHRVKVAGGDPYVFELEACNSIHHHSRGVPRLINILCDTAFVYGYAARSGKITAALVSEVLQDKATSVIFANQVSPLAKRPKVESAQAKEPAEVLPQADVSLDWARELFTNLSDKKRLR